MIFFRYFPSLQKKNVVLLKGFWVVVVVVFGRFIAPPSSTLSLEGSLG